MKVFKICARTSLLVLALACLAGATRAQGGVGFPIRREDYEAMRAEHEAEIMRRQMARDNERFKRESEHNRTRPAAFYTLAPPARKMTAEHKQRLYPSAAERASFAALLREDDTGLMRLLPYAGCVVDPRIVDVRGSCLDRIPPVSGGGSFYSFRAGKHRRAFASDIALRDGLFSVGFMKHTVGLLTALGDVPLDAVTLHGNAVRPFHKFVPAKTLAETMQDFMRSRAWREVLAHVYGATAPARVNTTYVLRSIAFDPTRGKPSDVLVAFRVTRQDADGAVTIAWKRLQKPKG